MLRFSRVIPSFARSSLFSKSMSTSTITTADALGFKTSLGLKTKATVYKNLSYDDIASHEKKNGEGKFISNGTFAIDTGKFTGRSPKDKYIVEAEPSSSNVWWGEVNQPMEAKEFDRLANLDNKAFDAINQPN